MQITKQMAHPVWITGFLDSIIQYSKEHNVPQTGYVSALPHLRMEAYLLSKTSRNSVFFRILDDGRSPKTQ
jgi:hypothetical protein